MSTPESSVTSAPMCGRVWRVLAVLGLAVGLTLVLDQFLLTLLPESHGFFERLLNGDAPTVDAGLPLALGLIAVSLFACVAAALRLSLRTFRGWFYFILILAATFVVNLFLVAEFPSVLDGFAVFLAVAFWKVYGSALVVIAAMLAAIGYVTWRVRPNSVRRFVVCSLIVAAILVVALDLIAVFPALLGAFGRWPEMIVLNLGDYSFGDFEITVGLIAIVPVMSFAGLWWLQRRSARWIAGGYLALVPVFVYMGSDDGAIRRPVTMEQLAPAFPGAEQSFAVLMRYGAKHPLGRNFRGPSHFDENLAAGELIDPAKPVEWQAFLTHHRVAIEADWSELAPLRAWWSELNAFDRIGDLTPTRLDAELVTFAPLRTMCQHGCAIASLQALDGRGDEAVATLLPILEVGRKLQPSARTLVRQMVAIVIERTSLQTAGFVLDHATISAAARARLSAALAASGGGAAGARDLLAKQYAYMLGTILDQPLGDMLGDIGRQHPRWAREPFNLIGPFVYNPRATFNAYGEYVAVAEESLANRRIDQMNRQEMEFAETKARPRFKNFMGAQILRLMLSPAYEKIAESYWKTQDNRAALLARLTTS